MKKIATTIIILAIFGIGLYYFYTYRRASQIQEKKFTSWQSFVPTSRLFKVFLPHPPHYAKDLIAIPNSDNKRRYDMYASEKIDGSLFLISVITYPLEERAPFSDDFLRQNIDELMRTRPENRLRNILEGALEKNKSFDFSFDNQDFRVEGRAIQDGHTVYMLTYITRLENFDSEEFKYFVQSFQILH